MAPSRLATALARWEQIVGAAGISVDPETLRRAEQATFETTARVPAVVRPANTAEVAGCLRVATELGVPMFPISGGRNWGFGSRVPTRDGCALLDLSGLDRIVDFDEQMAYVTVEPGVTFATLHAFLAERRSRLFASVTGSSPHSSVLANALERGDGSGPLGDRFAHTCALEVVLPTGDVVNTGFGRFEGSAVTPLHRFGVGPFLDGLFSQSNLGVVTRMTVWLSPLPHSLTVTRFDVDDGEPLGALLDACRTLLLEGTLRGTIGLWNDYRMLSAARQYPWDRTQGKTPLERERLQQLDGGDSLARWSGTLALYAPSAAQSDAAEQRIKALLGPVTRSLTVTRAPIIESSADATALPGDPAFRFFQGVPHEASLLSAYFRKRKPPSAALDLDADRCGVIWLGPTLPLEGAEVAKAAAAAERCMLEMGLEPLLAVVLPSPRVAYLLPMLVYDRDEHGGDARAMDCHHALMRAFVAAGHLPHRLGVQSMRLLPSPSDAHGALLARLKRALDPGDILAPGRYDFRESWPGPALDPGGRIE